MWSILGLLAIFVIPRSQAFSHGFNKKQIRTNDILIDGRVYRPVGDYQEDVASESNIPEADKLHPLQWLFKSVMGFWEGKKLIKSHSKHGKHKDENERTSQHKLETFNFHSHFQWHHERHPKFKSNPKAFKPKYSFKSKQEKLFEKSIHRRVN